MEVPSNKFQENLFNVSQVVKCVRTDESILICAVQECEDD
jgi:hypothetical protein